MLLILAVITLVCRHVTARWLPIANLNFNILGLFARELQAGTYYTQYAIFQPSCYCPVTQRRQQAILNNLERYTKSVPKIQNTMPECAVVTMYG